MPGYSALTLPERELAVELAFHVARRLEEELFREGGSDGTYWDRGESTWENGCSCMYALKVYSSETDHKNTWLPVVGLRDVRDHTRSFEDLTQSHLQDLLTRFVELSAAYSTEVGDSREPFSVEVTLEKVMSLLARHGYASRTGEHYVWTRKVGKHMREALVWTDQDGQTDSSPQDASMAAAREIYSAIPDGLRARFASIVRTRGELDAIEEMQHCWTGSEWSVPRGEKTGLLSLADVPTMKCLLELLRTGEH